MLHADLQVFKKSEFGISVEFTDLNHPIMVYLNHARNFGYVDRGISAYAGLHIPKVGYRQK
jgi:hypothetical protein